MKAVSLLSTGANCEKGTVKSARVQRFVDPKHQLECRTASSRTRRLATWTQSGLCEDWDFLLESGLELTSKKHSASSERTVGKWKLIGPKLRRLVFFSPEKLIEFVRNLIRKQHHGTAWVNALHVRPNYA